MNRVNRVRTYSELSKIKTFLGRYSYLKLDGRVGEETFGRDRLLNQYFYKRREWQEIRRQIIARDMGCDLGIAGNEFGPNQLIIIHHMNPIDVETLLDDSNLCLDPEYLISCSLDTHNGIHFGKHFSEATPILERKPYDTAPWRCSHYG